MDQLRKQFGTAWRLGIATAENESIRSRKSPMNISASLCGQSISRFTICNDDFVRPPESYHARRNTVNLRHTWVLPP